MYQIFITNMLTAEVEIFTYKNKQMALNRFKGFCLELGYKYTHVKTFNVFTAGGIGYPSRIELVEQQ